MTHMIELWGWRVSYKMNAQQSGSLLYCQLIQCNSSRGDNQNNQQWVSQWLDPLLF